MLPSLVCYLAHPVGAGDSEAAFQARQDNIGNTFSWLRWLVDNTPWSIAVPWLPYVQTLDEGIYRTRGIRDDLAMLERCDLIALCGGRVSPGMCAERDHAVALGIPVVDLTSLGQRPPALAADMASSVITLRATNALKAKPRRVWLPPITPNDLTSLRATRGLLHLEQALPDAAELLGKIIEAAERRP